MAKNTVKDRLMKLFGVKDEAEFEKKLGEPAKDAIEGGGEEAGDGDGEHTHIHIHGITGNGINGATGGLEEDEAEGGAGEKEEMPAWFKEHAESVDKRFKAYDETMGTMKEMLEKWAKQEGGEREHADDDGEEVTGEMAEEAPDGMADKAKKAHDSAFFADSFAETASMAEIIAPGLRLPTFDSAAKPKATYDSVCSLRRRALDVAYASDGFVRSFVDDMMPTGKTFDAKTCSCKDMRPIFRAVGAAKRRANNAGTGAAARDLRGVTPKAGDIRTPKDLNAMFAAHYADAGSQ